MQPNSKGKKAALLILLGIICLIAALSLWHVWNTPYVPKAQQVMEPDSVGHFIFGDSIYITITKHVPDTARPSVYSVRDDVDTQSYNQLRHLLDSTSGGHIVHMTWSEDTAVGEFRLYGQHREMKVLKAPPMRIETDEKAQGFKRAKRINRYHDTHGYSSDKRKYRLSDTDLTDLKGDMDTLIILDSLDITRTGRLHESTWSYGLGRPFFGYDYEDVVQWDCLENCNIYYHGRIVAERKAGEGLRVYDTPALFKVFEDYWQVHIKPYERRRDSL